MAWTMETDTEHVVNITTGQTDTHWAVVNQNDKHYDLVFHEETFKQYGLPEDGKNFVFFDAINTKILDTGVNFNKFEAAMEFFSNDLPNKVAIPLDVIDYIYQVTKNHESPLTVAIDKGIGYIPVINYINSLFGNLADQQNAHDQYMIINGQPYPFR